MKEHKILHVIIFIVFNIHVMGKIPWSVPVLLQPVSQEWMFFVSQWETQSPLDQQEALLLYNKTVDKCIVTNFYTNISLSSMTALLSGKS